MTKKRSRPIAPPLTPLETYTMLEHVRVARLCYRDPAVQAEATALCPVRALRAWLDLAGITAGPVFRGVMRNGKSRTGRLNRYHVGRIVQHAVGDDHGADRPPQARDGQAVRAAYTGPAQGQRRCGHHGKGVCAAENREDLMSHVTKLKDDEQPLAELRARLARAEGEASATPAAEVTL